MQVQSAAGQWGSGGTSLITKVALVITDGWASASHGASTAQFISNEIERRRDTTKNYSEWINYSGAAHAHLDSFRAALTFYLDNARVFCCRGDIKGAGSGSHYIHYYLMWPAAAQRVHVEHARPSSVNPNGPLIAPRHRNGNIKRARHFVNWPQAPLLFYFFPLRNAVFFFHQLLFMLCCMYIYIYN